MNRRNRKNNRRGAFTVEFALCLPILFFMFFTAYEFCRANMIRQTANNAAYEGARRAIVPGATAADAFNAATSMLATVGTSDATVTVDPTVIQEDTPQVTVTVTVPMNSNGYVAPNFFKDKTFVSSLTLAREIYEQTSVP